MTPPVKSRKKALKAAGLALAVACVLFQASCGMFRHKDKQPLYYGAVEAEPLQIPEGLDKPTSSGALIIGIPVAPLPQKEMQTVPPRISAQSVTNKNQSRILWSAEGAYLLVPDTQPSVYRRLGLVIKRSGMSISEDGVPDGYRFEYWHDSKDPDRGFFSKMAFWRDDPPNFSGSYQALTRAEGENTRITVKNADGTDADPDAAEHLLTILGERLG